MRCEEIDELLSDLIDDDLADGARAGVEAHLAACERCATSYRKLARTVRFVRRNGRVAPAPDTPGGLYEDFIYSVTQPSSHGARLLFGGGAGGREDS